MEYAYANDPAPSDAAGKTAPYHLDLRKLGHRSPSRVLRRREETCFSSSSEPSKGGSVATTGPSGELWDEVTDPEARSLRAERAIKPRIARRRAEEE